jgi:hypothetical protein
LRRDLGKTFAMGRNMQAMERLAHWIEGNWRGFRPVTLNEIGTINIHEGAGPRHPPKHRAVAYVIFAYV